MFPINGITQRGIFRDRLPPFFAFTWGAVVLPLSVANDHLSHEQTMFFPSVHPLMAIGVVPTFWRWRMILP